MSIGVTGLRPGRKGGRAVRVVVMVAVLAMAADAPTLAQAPDGGRRATQPATPLPGARLPAPEMRAVALADGTLSEQADAPASLPFTAGRIFRYFGETTDAFGRPWSIVGDPEAWRQERAWLVVPERFVRDLAPGTTLAFLDSLGTPSGTTAATRRAVRVEDGWWKEPVRLEATEVPRLGELLGVPAYRVPAARLDEVVGLAGGLEAFGPWPQEPARGQIHVGTALPLVWFWEDGWSPGTTPRMLSPVLGLLGNPLLVPDRSAPAEITGLPVPCWRLVGALDPAGLPVGNIAEAPAEPARVPGARQGDAALGARDFGELAWPVADEEVAAPRRVLLTEDASGVVIGDNSTRQAVYLEQVLPPELTRKLRGRTLALRVMARASPTAESTTGVSVGIELEAGGMRAGTSVQVGLRSTPLEVELLVPEDAESIRVRLLPQDLSIAVSERGRAVFDRATLAPIEWPAELTPDPLPLRRTLVVGYEPVRAYTRAPLAITERPEAQLRESWRGLVDDAELAGPDALELRRQILVGRVDEGMSERQVTLAWGEPESREQLDSLARLDWADRSAAFIADGLVAWSSAPESAAPNTAGECRRPGELPR